MEPTELQKTQIAYSHFTLEEWKLLVTCVLHRRAELGRTRDALDEQKVQAMLAKFPSVVL